MARGGARPGAGRPARKSPNTSPPSTRARARAREAAGNQRPWPADKVERWAIDRLIPYAKNATTHTDAQIAAIAASIKEWGWTTPALVGEDGGLIAGHARILAAASGWSCRPRSGHSRQNFWSCWRTGSRQFVEQRFGFFGRAEAFGEPAEDWRKKSAGLGAAR